MLDTDPGTEASTVTPEFEVEACGNFIRSLAHAPLTVEIRSSSSNPVYAVIPLPSRKSDPTVTVIPDQSFSLAAHDRVQEPSVAIINLGSCSSSCFGDNRTKHASNKEGGGAEDWDLHGGYLRKNGW